jgi:hypothetical protein
LSARAACSAVAPGASRANAYTQWLRRSSAASPAPTNGPSASGTNTAVRSSTVVPAKPRAATPTTVNARPFTTIGRPTAAGSAPRRALQYAWLTTAAGAAPGRSSAGPSRRPDAGVMPNVGK